MTPAAAAAGMGQAVRELLPLVGLLLALAILAYVLIARELLKHYFAFSGWKGAGRTYPVPPEAKGCELEEEQYVRVEPDGWRLVPCRLTICEGGVLARGRKRRPPFFLPAEEMFVPWHAFTFRRTVTLKIWPPLPPAAMVEAGMRDAEVSLVVSERAWAEHFERKLGPSTAD